MIMTECEALNHKFRIQVIGKLVLWVGQCVSYYNNTLTHQGRKTCEALL